VFFGIDHLVLCGTHADYEALAERLVPAGFVEVPGKLRFDRIGAHSRSLAYAGGGFVELVYEVVEGAAPRPWFGGPLPRVMGIGVSTDAFPADTEGWHWTMDEEQVLDDGSTLRIRAAGPHEHQSELYLFAMDRPDRVLDHPQLGGSAVLTGLRFTGAASEEWRERVERWLGAAAAVGPVELRFEPGPRPGVAVTPVFDVPSAAGRAELAVAAIELR
jgi:hypothetical protein